jgi:hypothetical protein
LLVLSHKPGWMVCALAAVDNRHRPMALAKWRGLVSIDSSDGL